MLNYLTLIFVCQLMGELITGASGLPIPGPVLGMVLLFGFLIWRGDVPSPLGEVAGSLQRAMSLLFVPAGAGVILHAHLLADALLPLGLALLVSTIVAVLITGFMMVWLSKEGQDG